MWYRLQQIHRLGEKKNLEKNDCNSAGQMPLNHIYKVQKWHLKRKEKNASWSYSYSRVQP
jgi:hypothetical protein